MSNEHLALIYLICKSKHTQHIKKGNELPELIDFSISQWGTK